MPKKVIDDEARFIEPGDAPTPDPDFVNDDEIQEITKNAPAKQELKQIMEALHAKHGENEKAALDEFREFIITRPDLKEAILDMGVHQMMVEMGVAQRRDN